MNAAMGFFSRLFARPEPAVIPDPAIPPGLRVYAVGDVHGRADLWDRMMVQIVEDSRDVPGRPIVVTLGDYIDRGPDSRGVLDRLVELQESDDFELRALMGNHEQAFLEFLDNPEHGPAWAEHGGYPTLSAFGVTPPRRRSDADAWIAAREALLAALPPAHLAFLRGLKQSYACGDYVFVHAGVRMGVPLEDQTERDLLWIRSDFLNADHNGPQCVVHGHTPADALYLDRFRIGLDTGAYATGVLSAVRLEGTERVPLQVFE